MQASILRFDRFELDLNSYELRESGRVIKLERLPTELLILLVESQGQLVTRDAIVQRLWGDNVFVDSRQGINTAVRKLRVALHDDPEHPRLLQTLTGRGYRLLAPVPGPAINSDGETLSPSPVPIASPSETTAAAATSSTSTPASRPIGRQSLLLAAITLVVVAAGIVWLFARRAAATHPATEQRITSNSPEAPVKFAVVSPDGRYLAYSDPTGLYLRVIATGEVRPWAVPKDFIASPNGWFPDGTHLLVTRFEGPMHNASLWKLSMLGANPRKLIDNAGLGSVSPDGTRIAFVATLPGWGREFWVMDSDGSNPHKIAAPGQPEPPNSRISLMFPPVWSPTGRRLAYLERHELVTPDPAEDAFTSLRTIDANGGDLQVILNDTRLDRALCWGADGHIFFAYREDTASDRTDQGVRSIRVDERTGKAIGQPHFVTNGAGHIGGMSVTPDGKRLVLWRMNTQVQGFIADFDAGTRKWKTPRRLTLDANSSLAEAWLADSKTVVFVSNRNGTWTLFKQALDETTAEVMVQGRSIFLPRLSADGSHMLYESRADRVNFSVPVSLMRLSVAGGPPQLVVQEAGIVNYQCAHLPSTLCILSKVRGTDHIFMSFDPEHGVGHELLRTTGGFNNWTLSPDGKTLAVLPGDHHVRFYSVENGGAHQHNTVTVNQWQIGNGDWSADGKGVLLPSVSATGTPVILEVDMAGKVSVVLEGAANTNFWWIIPSPDGHHGILGVEVPGDNNAWMIDKF
jgi:Tol biopolymer transport system component/DNA-binding winged helix-turn-helix (wHTH) protein